MALALNKKQYTERDIKKSNIAILSMWDFSAYDENTENNELVYTPLKFGFEDLRTKYNVDLYIPNKLCRIYRIAEKIFGSNAGAILIQLYCCRFSSEEYSAIYYPVDRHAIILAILRKMKLIKVPILMLNHFSYNTNYIESKKKRLFVKIERRLVFNCIDRVVFPCEMLSKIAQGDFPIKKEQAMSVGWGVL